MFVMKLIISNIAQLAVTTWLLLPALPAGDGCIWHVFRSISRNVTQNAMLVVPLATPAVCRGAFGLAASTI